MKNTEILKGSLDLHGENSRLFSISPGSPFLRTLATSLIHGKIVEGFRPVEDPMCLADATIYLPTRRAMRAFGIEVLKAMEEATGARAVILPRIRTFGDPDDDELILGLANQEPERFSITETICQPAKRQMQLAQLVKRWTTMMSPKSLGLLNNEPIILPSSSAEAIYLASDLANFIDLVETEGVDWKQLAILDPQDQDTAQWWQITLTFLKIIMEQWPLMLQASGEINPAEFRNRLIAQRIEQLIKYPANGPVIGAGSTGSVPATARMLKAIHDLPNGAVILPGFDLSLPNAITRRFETHPEYHDVGSDTVLSTHPQFGLVRLVQKLNAGHVQPIKIWRLGELEPQLELREKVLNLVMSPSSESNSWAAEFSKINPARLDEAFSNVSLIEAADQREEALAIALVLRKALADENKTAALITPDRALARRVSCELERFDIGIDDSAGIALSNTPLAMLARLLLRVATDSNDKVAFAGLLHHEFLLLGNSRAHTRPVAELLELAILRDTIHEPDLGDLAKTVTLARRRIEGSTYAPKLLKKLDEDGWQEIMTLAERLSIAIRPLDNLLNNAKADSLTLPQLLGTLREALLNCARLEGEPDALLLASGAKSLFELMDEYELHASDTFSLNHKEASAVMDALLTGRRVRQNGRSHPRLHLYGQLEARLQHADLFVLAGLNEGTWPQLDGTDPFLNRPMKSTLGVPLPERRLGLSAHDFCQFSGIEEVVYSRSKRSGEAPAAASRWLQRLETFLGKEHIVPLRKRGEGILDLCQQIDASEGHSIEINRPSPTPPVAARPQRLSVTEIETWIRDPYAIYAKHVLNLYALPQLVNEADAALRGTLYHAIMAEFALGLKGEINENTNMQLAAIAKRHLRAAALPPEIEADWEFRFNRIIEPYLNWEAEHAAHVKNRYCEIDAKMEIAKTGFILKGRADRIDQLKDGRLTVLDYKTGSRPTSKEARSIAPQLALEGLLAVSGGFEALGSGEIADLLYIRLFEGDRFKVDDISLHARKVVKLPEKIIEDAAEELRHQILAYQDPLQAYPSRPYPKSERDYDGDYDHLARVREWSLSGNDDEQDGEDTNQGAEE